MDGLEQAPMWGVFGIVFGLIFYFFRGKKNNQINLFFYILFCYYIARVLSLTLLPLPLTEAGKEIYREINREMINVIPLFNNIKNFNIDVILQWILNSIMFFPFGFLLPLSFKKEFDFKKIFLLSFLLSCMIEISQLCISYFWIGAGFRVCDINDLIFNTVGGLIGYLTLVIFLKFLRKGKKYENI